jgi:hypothetical protein
MKWGQFGTGDGTCFGDLTVTSRRFVSRQTSGEIPPLAEQIGAKKE